MKRLLAAVAATAAVAMIPPAIVAAPAGAQPTAGAPVADGGAVANPVPLAAPPLDGIFRGFVITTFHEGRLATIDEIIAGLNPAGDPFYDEPALTGAEAPGTVLRSERVQVLYSGFRPANVEAYRLMYVTRGVDDSPTISTGILMIPQDGRSNADRSLVAYQAANDSLGAFCHPTSYWTGADPMDAGSWSALGPLALMFNAGHAVMMSDVGNNGSPKPHGVFAGQFAGKAMLDGARAALALEPAGLNPRTPVGLFGIAGGGVGAGFAAQLQPDYAPELDVRGAVLEGMVVDQRSFMRVADGSIGSGFAFANLLGLEPWYPEMRIDDKLTPTGRTIADFYRGQCQVPAYFAMPFVPLHLLFTDGANPADIPDFQAAYADNLLGRTAPRTEVLISSCGADDSPMSLVPAQDSRDLATRWEAGGTSVTYAPSDCSTERVLTNLYGWGTDLFGMQTVDWLSQRLV